MSGNRWLFGEASLLLTQQNKVEYLHNLFKCYNLVQLYGTCTVQTVLYSVSETNFHMFNSIQNVYTAEIMNGAVPTHVPAGIYSSDFQRVVRGPPVVLEGVPGGPSLKDVAYS